jgi:hypothetical protein
MRTEALHLKLQGLWVGAALGELYAKGYFREAPSVGQSPITVKEAPLSSRSPLAQGFSRHQYRFMALQAMARFTPQCIAVGVYQLNAS